MRRTAATAPKRTRIAPRTSRTSSGWSGKTFALHRRVEVGVLLLEVGGDALHLLLRLFERDFGLEARDHHHVASPGLAVLVGEGERVPDLNGSARLGRPELDSRGKHAHDGDFLSVEPERFSHDVGIGAETPLPEAVSQEHHVVVSRDPILRSEHPTPGGGNPQRREQVRGDVADRDPLRLRPLFREIRGPGNVGRHRSEGARPLAPPQKVVRSDDVSSAVALVSVLPDHDQTSGILERKGLQEDAVDHAEDRGGGPDPEREKENRDQGEPGALSQHAESVAQIASETLP
jgi:hypothetical protein